MTELKIESYTSISNNLLALQLSNHIGVNHINCNDTTFNLSDKLNEGFEPPHDNDSVKIVQCTMLDTFNQTWFLDEKPEEDNLGNIIFKANNNGLTLAVKGIKSIEELGTGSTVHRLINALLIEFTQRRLQTITIPSKELMQLCGLANTKHNRNKFAKEIKKILALLNKLWLSFKKTKTLSQPAKSKGKRKNSNPNSLPLWTQPFYDQKLCDNCKLENGLISFELTTFFYDYLMSCNTMSTFKSIFKLDLRYYRNAPYMANKMLYYRNMKYKDKTKNKNKLIVLRLSVENLLLSSPFFKSLLMENLKGQGAKRIQEPFESAMDNLICIKDWGYCGDSGAVLTDKKLRKLNYNEFLRLYVEYEFIPIKQN